MRRISQIQARRIALAAQGFADAPPTGRVDSRLLRRVLRRVRLLQLDSVNVVSRAHYMPLYSRLGPYTPALIDRLAYERGELFEYWGHEASLMPIAHYPLMRHRMSAVHPWDIVQRLTRERPDYVASVLEEVRDRGPLSVSDLRDAGDRTGPWWGRSPGKTALEWHFAAGNLGAVRTDRFVRVYDLPERLYSEACAAPVPPAEEAQRALLREAAQALGVGNAADLADYYRIRVPAARPRLAELVERGELEPVRVEGWRHPAYLAPGAKRPRAVHARTLLSPFDSLIFFRARTERLFDFRYRIEIYVPAAKRQYGYYVLPFLQGERLVARTDLKAVRDAGYLAVQGAWREPGEDALHVARELAVELRRYASWLGLGEVRVGRRGDLAAPLRRALSRK